MAESVNDANRDAHVHHNQPFDESLDVADAEEVASLYTPTPRVTRPEAERGEQSRGETPPESRMSNQSDEEIESNGAPTIEPLPKRLDAPAKMFGNEDDEDGSDSTDDEDDDDDDEGNGATVEGAYDPNDYEHLPTTAEIKELFQYITRYTPQTIELEHKLKPFIPDFIPAVGDIDAFLKVTRPDSQQDKIGLTVLDEPCAKQADPIVLDLQMRALSKQTNLKQVTVKSIDGAERDPKAIDNWIDSITDLHRTKAPPNVHYTRNMPDIDSLMQEWPANFEELLKEVGLPTADLDCSLSEYIDMICALVDIPIYKSKVQSLHVLFTLYCEFKNSQHFQSLAEANKVDNSLKTPSASADQLIL